MELIDTLAEREIRELNFSPFHLRKLGITYIFRNSDEKTIVHDGFHPFTTMSFHIIFHSSCEKKVDLAQNSFHLILSMSPSGGKVIERWMKDSIRLGIITLEEAIGYLDNEER